MEVTKLLIKRLFDRYNKDYFDNKLGKCKFYFLSRNDSAFGRYNKVYDKKGNVINKIWIGTNTDFNEEQLREVLIHEMIHMYVETIDKPLYSGLFGHGYHFRKQCRRIKKEFGINIPINSKFERRNKKLSPKLWERVITSILDWL